MIGDSATRPVRSFSIAGAWRDRAGRMLGRRPDEPWSFRWMLLLPAAALLGLANPAIASSGKDNQHGKQWIGTWAAAAQQPLPGSPQSFRNQGLRLIVHTSAGGKRVRIRISNTYGDHPLLIGGAHIARRTVEADIDPASDRVLKFHGQASTKIPARSMVISDPVDLAVPALSDLAVSLFFPETTRATTYHIAAKQTSYISPETGDSTADVKFPVAKKIRSWPFLTGVDVEVSRGGAAIVALGSSLTDGDGSTPDTNRRWPDVFSERLQKEGGRYAEVGVLNEGIIGNRLLEDSPAQQLAQYGSALGEAGLARFERDVLAQPGVKYVFVGLGINDIAFPGSLTPQAESVSAESIISGYRQLIARAHKKRMLVIGATNPPFEGSFLNTAGSRVTFYTPEKESVRQKVNAWILSSKEFDAAVDFDAAVRDPSHPTRILPAYDSGDHLHPNDAGYIATANVIPLAIFTHH
jgi:lysophospholipase L1-like esterase